MNLLSGVPRLLLVATCCTAALRAADTTPTVIASDSGEMVSSATQTTFTFTNHVVVTGTNIRLTCDKLVVIANRSGDPKATFGKQDQFKSLVATGHVRMLQSNREATCERAEVFPGEDRAVLSGNPKVRTLDGQYSVAGPIMKLYRGQMRAEIEGGTQITLPPLPDLGPGNDTIKTPQGDASAATPTATAPATTTSTATPTTPPPAPNK